MLVPGWPSVGAGAEDSGPQAAIADLVDGLAFRGHEVHLVAATPGRTTSGRRPGRRGAPAGGLGEPLPEFADAVRATVALTEAGVDLIHDHTMAGPLLAGHRAVPTVVTARGSLADADNGSDYYRALAGRVGLVAVSAAQRGHAPDLGWLATVPTGIRVDSVARRTDQGEYLLWLGRYQRQDAPHLAIDAAAAANLPIVLAGIGARSVDKTYFREQVRTRVGRGVRMHGVADSSLTHRLLAGARTLVVPTGTTEPSGRVLVEAMAHGTPVVALAQGVALEIVADGRTGILCGRPDELPAAIARAGRLDPADCRARAEEAFGVDHMVDGYEAAYAAALSRPRAGSAGHRPAS
jgi:glycosyltransferase involved in cell wall biosynthesis